MGINLLGNSSVTIKGDNFDVSYNVETKIIDVYGFNGFNNDFKNEVPNLIFSIQSNFKIDLGLEIINGKDIELHGQTFRLNENRYED